MVASGKSDGEAAAPVSVVHNPGMSDAAIRGGTGRGWDEWLALLDAWGGTSKTHPEIATFLNEVHGVDGWWAQGVTVGYERARGMRAVGQLPDGYGTSEQDSGGAGGPSVRGVCGSGAAGTLAPRRTLHDQHDNAKQGGKWRLG